MHRGNVTTACSNCVRPVIAAWGFSAGQFEEGQSLKGQALSDSDGFIPSDELPGGRSTAECNV
jgi:hypothetical protein